jgi:hypothetical protein
MVGFDEKCSSSSISINSKNISEGSNNIYDIICYYKEEDENYDNVNAVIENIQKVESRSREAAGENYNNNNNNNENKYYRHDDKRRQREWIKMKLFGCLLINVFLSSPIYGFATIYSHIGGLDGNILLIWIPIIFNATYLIVTPWLFNPTSYTLSSMKASTFASSSSFSSKKLTNRNVIIFFTLIMSTAISFSGFVYAYLDANFILILLSYAVIGGNYTHSHTLIRTKGNI